MSNDVGCSNEDAHLQEIDELHYLGLQIFYRRDERGWSQQEVADRAGLSQPQIARIESGEGNPTVRTLSRVACAFECGISDLFRPIDKHGRLKWPGGFGAEASGKKFGAPGSQPASYHVFPRTMDVHEGASEARPAVWGILSDEDEVEARFAANDNVALVS